MLLVIALSLFILLASIVIIGRSLSGTWPEVAAAMLMVVVSPLGFFRAFGLPDPSGDRAHAHYCCPPDPLLATKRTSFILGTRLSRPLADSPSTTHWVPLLVIG